MLTGTVPGHHSTAWSHALCRSQCHQAWHLPTGVTKTARQGSCSIGSPSNSWHRPWNLGNTTRSGHRWTGKPWCPAADSSLYQCLWIYSSRSMECSGRPGRVLGLGHSRTGWGKLCLHKRNFPRHRSQWESLRGRFGPSRWQYRCHEKFRPEQGVGRKRREVRTVAGSSSPFFFFSLEWLSRFHPTQNKVLLIEGGRCGVGLKDRFVESRPKSKSSRLKRQIWLSNRPCGKFRCVNHKAQLRGCFFFNTDKKGEDNTYSPSTVLRDPK